MEYTKKDRLRIQYLLWKAYGGHILQSSLVVQLHTPIHVMSFKSALESPVSFIGKTMPFAQLMIYKYLSSSVL